MCTSQHHSHLVSTAWGSPDDQPTQPLTPIPDPVCDRWMKHGRDMAEKRKQKEQSR